MHLQSLPVALAVATAAFIGQVCGNSYNYVVVFSIDGLHGSDVPKYVALRPQSTIAELLENGYEYTDAWTSAPSDSFPGSLNVFTGAHPRTTGVWYDDTYDRAFYKVRKSVARREMLMIGGSDLRRVQGLQFIGSLLRWH
jgi:Type I phosphodiesterase / nucleotide pyrophosphatase